MVRVPRVGMSSGRQRLAPPLRLCNPEVAARGRYGYPSLPEYELYAIRYAERDARRSNHFISGDPHDGPMPMDYFVWVATAPHHTVVIDTGSTAEVDAARKRRFLRCPIEALSLVGGDGNIVG